MRIELLDLDSSAATSEVRAEADALLAGGFGAAFRSGRVRLLGSAEGDRIAVASPWDSSAALLAEQFRQQFHLEGSADGAPPPVALAALAFDVNQPGELLVPARLLIERDGRRFLQRTLDTQSPPLGIGPASADSPPKTAVENVEDPAAWRLNVEEVLRRIRADEVDKVVLFRTLSVLADRPFDAAAIFARLEATNPVGLAYLVDGFVGVSPELLVERHGEMVRAQPMAGTMPLTGDSLVDAEAAQVLFSDEKLRAEHAITIDRLHRALLGWCSYLDSEPEPSVIAAATVQHLATAVEGRLSRPVPSVLELVGALHPTPAVGGWPVRAATAIISEIEPESRGRAAGPVGWTDTEGNGQFAVGIRCAQLNGRTATAHAGVGIVDGSDPEVEFAETTSKFNTVLSALRS